MFQKIQPTWPQDATGSGSPSNASRLVELLARSSSSATQGKSLVRDYVLVFRRADRRIRCIMSERLSFPVQRYHDVAPFVAMCFYVQNVG